MYHMSHKKSDNIHANLRDDLYFKNNKTLIMSKNNGLKIWICQKK